MIELITGLKPKPEDIKMIVALCVCYFGLRSEIHENKIINSADKQVMNYRLARLESFHNITAILPKELKLEGE